MLDQEFGSVGGTEGRCHNRTPMLSRRHWFVVGLAFASACATTPAAPPLASFANERFAGTVRSGSVVRALPDDPGAPAWFEIRVSYADDAPAGASISAFARQVFVEDVADPVRARSELARGIGLADAGVPASETFLRVDPAWPATVVCWRTTLPPADGAGDPPRAAWRSFSIELEPAADARAAPALALVLEGQEGAREHLVLDALPEREDGLLRLHLPAPRQRAPRGGFLAAVRRIPDPPDAKREVELARSALAASVAGARTGSGALTREEGFVFESESAFRALETVKLRRSALAYLAQATRADVAGDLAVGASDADLAAIVASLRERAGDQDPSQWASAKLGWFLETSGYGYLSARAADEQHPIEPELAAVLLVHVGQLARFPDLIVQALADSDGPETFAQHVLDENTIFLEDADPAARLRAYEWLRERGAAPEGYDPLGELRARRAALDRARTAAAVPPGGPR